MRYRGLRGKIPFRKVSAKTFRYRGDTYRRRILELTRDGARQSRKMAFGIVLFSRLVPPYIYMYISTRYCLAIAREFTATPVIHTFRRGRGPKTRKRFSISKSRSRLPRQPLLRRNALAASRISRGRAGGRVDGHFISKAKIDASVCNVGAVYVRFRPIFNRV